MAEKKLKQIECDPKCGFFIRSHDENELVEMAIRHAKTQHNKTITKEDVTAMMKDA
ncbi:MAG: DUF1059 domain-containing protein [Smithella sp.]